MKALTAALSIAALALLATSTFAEDPAPGPKNAQGLTAVLIANTATYTLDPATSGDAFKATLAKAANPRANVRLPKPPVVDLTMRITNTTDKPITIMLNGDDSQIQLKLDGPGAATVDNMVAMTMDFRMGTPVTIDAGKSYDIKISSLAFGMRGISKYAFWTDAGDYTLTATLLYSAGDAHSQTTVTSGPAKLKVEAAK